MRALSLGSNMFVVFAQYFPRFPEHAESVGRL